MKQAEREPDMTVGNTWLNIAAFEDGETKERRALKKEIVSSLGLAKRNVTE